MKWFLSLVILFINSSTNILLNLVIKAQVAVNVFLHIPQFQNKGKFKIFTYKSRNSIKLFKLKVEC
jgi:hypothetical protein